MKLNISVDLDDLTVYDDTIRDAIKNEIKSQIKELIRGEMRDRKSDLYKKIETLIEGMK